MAVTLVLMLFWRSGLGALDPGLPLFGSVRSARCDIVAVGFAWLAALFLEAQLRRPCARTALAVGLATGAACLTQFHGAFVVPALAVAWFTLQPIRAVHDERLAGDPMALLRSLLTELFRLAAAAEFHGAGPWLLLVGIVPVFVLVARGARRQPVAQTLVLMAAASIVLCLALTEHTKAPLYALPLLPAICIAFALVLASRPGSRLIRRGRHRPPSPPPRLRRNVAQ